jgi:ribosomal protein S18 acetylase RimI-like enzyme
LLSPMPQGDAVELVYLGLTPSARGRRIADWVLRYGLASVAAVGRNRLSLAVDSTNAPALKLYYRHGMKRVTSKLAMMRDLRPGVGREGVRSQESGVREIPQAQPRDPSADGGH